MMPILRTFLSDDIDAYKAEVTEIYLLKASFYNSEKWVQLDFR